MLTSEHDWNPNGASSARWPSRRKAWLQLLRPPNLLTVPGDPIAGFLLTSAAGSHENAGVLAASGAVVASLALYCAGLLLNDYCDLDTDRRQRPSRPLPRGTIQPGAVLNVFVLLSVLGVGVAAMMAGAAAACVAVTLLLAIIAYDTRVKRHRLLGPLNMGMCRGLSLLLGAAAAGRAGLTSVAVVIAACLLTAYVAAVTDIASRETQAVRIGLKRYLPLAILVAGFAGLLIAGQSVHPAGMLASATLTAATLLWAAHCGRTLRNLPAPAVVQTTIGRFLRGLLLIQAALAATVFWQGLPVAAILLAAWPAATLLARRFYAS